MIPQVAETLYTSSDYQHDHVLIDNDTGLPVDWTGLTVTVSITDKSGMVLQKVSTDGGVVLSAGGLLSVLFPDTETVNLVPEGLYQLAIHIANGTGALNLVRVFSLPVVRTYI
jgi:hypothetical protein